MPDIVHDVRFKGCDKRRPEHRESSDTWEVNCRACLRNQGYSGALADLNKIIIKPHEAECECELCKVAWAFLERNLQVLDKVFREHMPASVPGPEFLINPGDEF